MEYILDPYNEEDAKRHIIKVREMLFFPSQSSFDGTKSYASIDYGVSQFPNITGLDSTSSIEKSELLESKDFFNQPSLSELVPDTKPITKCAAHSVQLSQWNPPTPDFRAKGHLLYLLVTTLEGDMHYIVSHTSGFYISKSTAHWFDPTPNVINNEILHEHSLYNLIMKASPKAARVVEENKAKMSKIIPQAIVDPIASYMHAPWFANAPIHVQDIARTQSLVLEEVEMNPALRDWNEEIQTSVSLEGENWNERLLRERLLVKTAFEFSQAAIHGAINIIKGNVYPLNPGEAVESQIYLYEGIFYSYASDPTGTYAGKGGIDAARYCAKKDLNNVILINKYDNGKIRTILTVIVDYLGHRVIAQAPVPGIFTDLPDEESRIAYGSIENDSAIVADKTFVDGLKGIADAFHLKKHVAFDVKGNGVELVTPSSANGVLGNDNRKYILDLNRMTPLDLGFLESVKGDSETPYPHTTAVLRPEVVEIWWRKKFEALYEEKLSAKREAVAAETKEEADSKPEEPKEKESKEEEPKEGEEKKEGEEEKPEEKPEDLVTLTPEEESEITKFILEKYRINPDVPLDLSKIPEGEARKEYAEDAKTIHEISSLIVDELIPGYVESIRQFTSGHPFDGAQLTAALHKRGISMRYLGKIAEVALAPSKDPKNDFKLVAFHNLVVREIISRAAKHVFNDAVKGLSAELATYVITQLFNCLFGFKLNSSPKIEVPAFLLKLYESKINVEEFKKNLENITVESVRGKIALEAKKRYRYNIKSELFETVNLRILFRELSKKLGLQWLARNYDFDATEPYYEYTTTYDSPAVFETVKTEKTSKKKKSKGKKPDNSSPLPEPTPALLDTMFHPSDILNIVPVFRYSTYPVSLAEEAFEMGRRTFVGGDKTTGMLLMDESITLYEQIYGPIHIEVARAYLQLALIQHEVGEYEKASRLGRKGLVICERVLGIDDSETIIYYLNVSLFEFGNNNPSAGLMLLKHVAKYWSTVIDNDNPEIMTTSSNCIRMMEKLKMIPEIRNFFESFILERTIKLFGEDSEKAALTWFQMAQYDLVLEKFEPARENFSKAHEIFKLKNGEEDNLTKETLRWVEFTSESSMKSIQKALKKNNVAKELDSTIAGKRPEGKIANSSEISKKRNNNKSNGKAAAAADAKDNSFSGMEVEDILKYINSGSEGSSIKKTNANNNDKKGGNKKHHKKGKK